MSNHTKANLKEVGDRAPEFGMPPGIEARFARRALEFEKSGMTYFKFEPAFRTPFGHRHTEQEEVYVVASGSGRIKIDEEVVELATWDAVRVPAQATRCLEAGPDGAEVIAFGAGPNGAQEAEMVPGWWKD